MNSTAKKALEKLLRSAENFAGKSTTDNGEASPRTIQVKFNQSSFPDYLGIATHAEKVACNAALMLAERDGAISIKWDTRAGNNESIEQIRLVDRYRLATVLGVTPRWDLMSSAEKAFTPFLDAYPVLLHVLDVWRGGGAVRFTKPIEKSIQDWLDAIKVVDASKESAKENRAEKSIRRLSSALFSDSKRIENISHLIDVLTQGKINGLPREQEEFFQEMGLVKFPSTLLMAASQNEGDQVSIKMNERLVDILVPYIGLPPQAIDSINFENSPMAILTVENLTTFHEITEKLKLDSKDKKLILVMYTGGMPSPSWRRVYRLALTSLPTNSTIWHWGDVDLGGLRIANKLAEDCEQCGKSLQLHLMGVAPTVVRKTLLDTEISAIETICLSRNWVKELQSIKTHRSAIEQETLEIQLPI